MEECFDSRIPYSVTDYWFYKNCYERLLHWVLHNFRSEPSLIFFQSRWNFYRYNVQAEIRSDNAAFKVGFAGEHVQVFSGSNAFFSQLRNSEHKFLAKGVTEIAHDEWIHNYYENALTKGGSFRAVDEELDFIGFTFRQYEETSYLFAALMIFLEYDDLRSSEKNLVMMNGKKAISHISHLDWAERAKIRANNSSSIQSKTSNSKQKQITFWKETGKKFAVDFAWSQTYRKNNLGLSLRILR